MIANVYFAGTKQHLVVWQRSETWCQVALKWITFFSRYFSLWLTCRWEQLCKILIFLSESVKDFFMEHQLILLMNTLRLWWMSRKSMICVGYVPKIYDLELRLLRLNGIEEWNELLNFRRLSVSLFWCVYIMPLKLKITHCTLKNKKG